MADCDVIIIGAGAAGLAAAATLVRARRSVALVDTQTASVAASTRFVQQGATLPIELGAD